MNKYIKTIIILLSATILIAFFGCSIAMDALTPCPIQPQAAAYADEPITDFLLISTVWDAKRIDAKMDYVHESNQINFARLMEDDNNEYEYLKDIHVSNIQSALQLQESVFSPTSPVGALIPGLSGLGLGAYLISKPEDRKKIKKLENGG